jgi:hypothetical protein
MIMIMRLGGCPARASITLEVEIAVMLISVFSRMKANKQCINIEFNVTFRSHVLTTKTNFKTDFDSNTRIETLISIGIYSHRVTA